MIRLPRHEVERHCPRPDFATQVAQQSYTQPHPAITPGGLAHAGSWGMSQHIGTMGHLEVRNGQTYVILHG